MSTAVDLAAVGKRYWQLEERRMLLRALVPVRRPRKTALWALKDVTTSIEHGETVGILGRNGAGKTTLLRLLAGVSRPTTGRVSIRGRVAPLLSVGVGFHQEMTGRENIYVNGMLLGLSRSQVRARIDDVISFAELSRFIDTPVKFYSSGMFMRLGFAVAAHADPDLLLVDEVLAVGDIAFQLKCLDKMRQMQGEGTTIILVSHSMYMLSLLCPRSLLIQNGNLDFDGETNAAVGRHHQLLGHDARSYDSFDGNDQSEAPAASLLEKVLLGRQGATTSPDRDDVLTYRATVRLKESIDSPHLFFYVMGDLGVPIYSLASTLGQSWRKFAAGDVITLEVRFRARLGGGTYRLVPQLLDRYGRRTLWSDEPGMFMYMPPKIATGGYADLDGSISIDGVDMSGHRDPLMVRNPMKNESAPAGSINESSPGNHPD